MHIKAFSFEPKPSLQFWWKRMETAPKDPNINIMNFAYTQNIDTHAPPQHQNTNESKSLNAIFL